MPRVEFYGIPRERTGVAAAHSAAATLGGTVAELAARFPRFAADCVDPPCNLKPQVVANVGGDRFVREPDTPLASEEVLLIMSADAGG